MSEGTREIDQLVLVVHGVGDPAPGETVGLLARSLADPDSPLEESQQIVWLPEKAQSETEVSRFACHVRNLKMGDRRVEMAEVFWGDLSRVRKGFPGVIRGIFEIVFGLRYIAYVAADQPGRATEWLKRLGLISSRILHGPVLAVTFFLAILSMGVLASQLLWSESYKSVVWTQVVLGGCCGFAILAAEIGNRITQNRVLERYWFWVNVTAMFVAGLMFIKPTFLEPAMPELAFSVRPGLIWFCRILVVLLGFLWFVEMLVLGAMAACWLIATMNRRLYRPALHVSILLPALTVGIWGLGLPMSWVMAKEGIKRLGELEDFSRIFDEAIPLLGVQFLMMLTMTLVGVGVVIRYFTWRAKITVEEYLGGRKMPRLIIHEFLQGGLAVCTALGVFLVFLVGCLQLVGLKIEQYAAGMWLEEMNKYAIGALVPLGGLLIALVPKLRAGFDIVLDVVNHFYFRATSLRDALDHEDEFDIVETTFESGSLFFSRRDAIHIRLKRILTHYRDRLTQQTDLVLMAHSQGTMIAIEVLNDPELSWLKNRFESITLVTMGSPMSNLYQHYFSHLYPPLENEQWDELRQRVDRWENFYRVDDYVGREIEFPTIDSSHQQGLASESTPVYINHAFGPRGHLGYWTDREVLKILRTTLKREVPRSDLKAA